MPHMPPMLPPMLGPRPRNDPNVCRVDAADARRVTGRRVERGAGVAGAGGGGGGGRFVVALHRHRRRGRRRREHLAAGQEHAVALAVPVAAARGVSVLRRRVRGDGGGGAEVCSVARAPLLVAAAPVQRESELRVLALARRAHVGLVHCHARA
eukprot:1576106-Rhodomonas_salina.1